MSDSTRPQISYCSTCMNRSDQLKQTLEKNLKVVEQFKGKIELCLVNFIKDEEGEKIHEWILSLGAAPYFRYAISRKLDHWHAPTAKNTAHLLGQADYLINLDCDNFIAPSVVEKLLALPQAQLNSTVFSGFTGSFEQKKVKVKEYSLMAQLNIALESHKTFKEAHKPKWQRTCLRSIRKNPDQDLNGTYGHIGLSKELFVYMKGYDEAFPPMGGQDKDVLWRAFNFKGIGLTHIPQPASHLPILNNKTDSLKNSESAKENWTELANQGNKLARSTIKERRLIANIDKTFGVDVEIIHP